MFQWAKSLFGRSTPGPAKGSDVSTELASRFMARYDNAETNHENERYWSNVDYFSANAANTFQVRRTLRIRSRYEVTNNPYLFGITNNNADDLISSGPTLEVKSGREKYDRDIEQKFAAWSHEVELVEKLRTCKLAKTVDGEGFLILKTVKELESPVKLYPVDIEADQVTTPAPKTPEEYWVDGLILHPVTGRPVKYNVLRHHPGDFFLQDSNPLRVDVVDAGYVIHWFPKFRPGQARGVPVFTSSLGLASALRAFREAVLSGAQIAADFAAVIQSKYNPAEVNTTPAGAESGSGYKPFQRVGINRGQMVFLPAETEMRQFDPKQPATSYEMFQEKCLAEACRPLAYPLNLALGTSQKFNFSSAKLDHINYRESLSVERKQCERVVLHKIFSAWFQEAVLVGEVQPFDGIKPPPHVWHWPGFTSLDPLVDAEANALLLASKQMSWQQFAAQRGMEWKEFFKQISDEAKEIERLGIVIGEPVKRTVTETTNDEAEPANAA